MSSEPVSVSVRNLAKSYDLGVGGRTTSLREIIANRVRQPFAPRRRRDRFRALEGVSFEVRRGEVVGIIGRNGAGKSTLLKILSRITYPDMGEVDLLGRVGSLLEVGTGFHPELTGYENIYLNGAILGMKRTEIEERLDEITAFAEVDEFLDTPVKRYSSGMRVRLAFSVAAHLDPEILIIDEVLSVGDANFQSKSVKKMEQIAAQDGRTVIYVSHNLVSIEYLCPRTIVLEQGRIVFDGETTEAIGFYLATTTPDEAVAVAPGVFDLANRARVEGTQKPVLQRLRLLDRQNRPTDTVPMNGFLRVEIDVEGLSEIRDPVFMLGVGSEVDRTLFKLTNQMKQLSAIGGDRSRHERLTVDFPRLPLTAGAYTIGLVIRSGVDNLLVDRVQKAAEFFVAETDVWGTGYKVRQRDGALIVDWEWGIGPSEQSRPDDCN